MILVLEKVFRILSHLSTQTYVPLGDVVKKTGYHKTTVCNLLRSMKELGYVENSGTGAYRLSARFAALSAQLPVESAILDICRVRMKSLAEKTLESGVAAILRAGTVSILAQALYPRNIVTSVSVYDDLSLYHSVCGRVLFAHLDRKTQSSLWRREGPPGAQWDGITRLPELRIRADRIRAEGIGIMENEEHGLKAFAVPVFASDDKICCAFGLTVPLFRLNDMGEERIRAALKEAADAAHRENREKKLTSHDWMPFPGGL